jgi:type III pantothenate kinase
MNLLIDVGNSRIKWAWSEGDRTASDQISLAHGGEIGEEWLKLAAASGARPQRILIANVAGARVAAELTRMLLGKYSVTPEYATVTAAAAGVTCAYRDPSQLGVDRWVAIIGAWHRAKRAVCVIDSGTATTVDAVDADGRHLGGLILPGLDLMEDSLLKRTSDIARVIGLAARPQATLFAGDTAAAVRNGAAFATAALAERAAAELEKRAGQAPSIYLTGGNATRVTPCLTRAGEVLPDLVLLGLAALCR